MKIEVNKNYVVFNTNEKVNKKEFKATPLEFTFSKDYESLTCKAIFSKIPKTSDEEVTFYQQPIIDGKCFIPYEVLDGEVEGILIGVYGYEIEDNELKVRYSPEPKNLWLLEGSYYEGASTPEEITPSQFEQYTSYLNSQVSLINEKIEELDRINIETERLSNGVRISVTNSDGETTITEVYDGEKGEPGERGEPGEPGTTDYEDLINKPSINGTTLEGDVSLEDIGIGNVFTIKGSVSTPEDLPATGNSIGDVYYVESVMAGYVWIEVSGTERWEELGEPIDLSNYYTKTETDSLLDDKQDTLTAGTGIDITNNVISASAVENTFYWDGTNTADNRTMFEKIWSLLQQRKCVNLYLPSGVGNRKFNVGYEVYGNNLYLDINFIWFGKLYYYEHVTASFNNDGTIIGITPLNTSNIQVRGIAKNYNTNVQNTEFSVLAVNNTKAFTPTADFHPATKKYVDDSISTEIGNINAILATLTTPSNGGGN